MKATVFTPVHPTSLPYLAACAESLRRQEDPGDFEWVILPNGGVTEADVASATFGLPARVLPALDTPPGHGKIGALKRACCEAAAGDYAVELDADDLLVPTALRRIGDAFRDGGIHFAYSDFAEANLGWEPMVYGSQYGWSSYPFVYRDFVNQDRLLVAMRAFEADHNSVRRVEWAPNHVRAWRLSSYREVGGHDPGLHTGDDHDLVCRFYVRYGSSGFRRIGEPLYVYRVHGKNSCSTHNADVQAQVAKNYLRHYRPMAERWARERDLARVDLGGRFDAPAGYLTVDRVDADVVCDLEDRWPFMDSTVGVLRAHHVFEHLRDPVHAMNEAHRVLAPGGVLFMEVPTTDGRGAWQDPTHVSFWNPNSLWYYTRESHARYIRPEYRGRFACAGWREVDWGNDIKVMQAELIALKDGYRPPGVVEI